MDADGYLFQYVCSKKEYPAPESGQDAAKPAGVAPVCRGWVCWVLIHADSATIFPGAAPILIHAGFAAIFSGAARVRRTMAKKVPAPVTGAGDGAE